ncbi:MAG TPA: RNA-binding protein [Desulfuromonadales bacterium]|nr:RNA-binding protein [Desulfuromonadales bacterium]
MAKELYVGHISEQATEEDLRKLFSVMGVVTSVHLIVDQETGEFKRCGYVRMLAEVDLKEVVETLDGAWLIDRVITVSVAKPQKDRPVKGAAVRKKFPGAKRAPAAQHEKSSERPSPASRTNRQEVGAASKTARSGGRRSAKGRP